MVAVHEPARHDALHALVPALAAHHDDAAAGVGLLHARERLLGELRLDGAALLVGLLEPGGEARRLDGVTLEQKVEGERRIRHAPRGVEPGDEREREGVSRDGGEIHAAHARERNVARARGGAHLGDALGDERAVLGREEHHVGHGAERRHLEVALPKVGCAAALAQHLDELERHAGAGELA